MIASSAADVRRAVLSARAQGLRVAVRATGHGTLAEPGPDTLLIDTSAMRSVLVDPERRTARVGPGATAEEGRRRRAPVRPRADHRHVGDRGRRRLHARRRPRLALAQVRARRRQPPARRCGDRRRRAPDRARRPPLRPVLGAGRRGRELRRRDLARNSPAPGEPRVRRHGDVRPRSRAPHPRPLRRVRDAGGAQRVRRRHAEDVSIRGAYAGRADDAWARARAAAARRARGRHVPRAGLRGDGSRSAATAPLALRAALNDVPVECDPRDARQPSRSSAGAARSPAATAQPPIGTSRSA